MSEIAVTGGPAARRAKLGSEARETGLALEPRLAATAGGPGNGD